MKGELIFGDFGIDLFGPGGDAAGDIPDVGEAVIEKEGDSFGAATAEFAVNDDLLVFGNLRSAQGKAG